MIKSSASLIDLDLSTAILFDQDTSEALQAKALEATRKAYREAKPIRPKKKGRPKKSKCNAAWVGIIDKATGMPRRKKKYKQKKYIPKPEGVWVSHGYVQKFVTKKVASKYHTGRKRKRYHYPENTLPLINLSENVTHEGSTFYSVKGTRKKSQNEKATTRKNAPRSKEELRLYAKKYYAENKAKVRAASKKYYETNKEKAKLSSQKYYAENKEAMKLKFKERYANRQESEIVKKKEYYAKNKEKILATARQKYQEKLKAKNQ